MKINWEAWNFRKSNCGKYCVKTMADGWVFVEGTDDKMKVHESIELERSNLAEVMELLKKYNF